MRKALGTAGIAGALALGQAHPLAAQLALPSVVNPAAYKSRSGVYSLEVDPGQMCGEGGGAYRLLRRGEEVWAGERPFTLLEAAVGDDGTAAGYAYLGGVEGFAKQDSLHLVILDPRGAVRLDESTPRKMSNVVDGGPEPNVLGLVFDPDNDRVVFRVANVSEPEVWKAYRLSDGKALVPFKPVSMMGPTKLSLSVTDAKPVRGTPLTLIQCWRDDWQKEERGARFALVDLSGKPVWVLDLPKDYQAASGDRKKQERVWSLGSTSGILDVSRPREFEIRVVATSERVVHLVESDGKGGWSVRETGRRPHAQDMAAEPQEAMDAAFPRRQLRHLGAIGLGGPRESGRSVFRRLHDFDLDGRGRVGFAREDAPCELSLVVADTDGGAPREKKLGRLEQQGCSRSLVAWAGGSRWAVTAEFAKAEKGEAGWWVDAENGRLQPLKLPPGLSVRAIAGRPGGGIVVLGELEASNAFGHDTRTVLLWLGAQGQEERRFSEGANSSASRLLSPNDVTVTTTGETMVIDVIRHRVVVFDPKGSLVRAVDLDKAWGRPASYPSGIAPDADGGFICEDFGAAVPFVRMRSDGSVRSGLQPRYEDGRPTGRLFRVRAGPDGSVWGSDGEALLRLNEDGVVDRAIGAAADPDDLGEIAAVTVDAMDRIYAADRRTGAVHVYSPGGEPLHVCRPARGDVTEALKSPSLTVTTDGRIYLRPDDGLQDRGGFIECSPAGERVAGHAWRDRSRLWNPANGGFWALGWHEISLLDQRGETVRTIQRRPDRTWLDWVSGAVVASDGSIAVDAESHGRKTQGGGRTLNLYAADGTAIGSVPVPVEVSRHFAYDGRHIAVLHSGDVRILDTTGKALFRFRPQPDGKQAQDWPLVLAAQGRELWLLDAATKTLHRYEMP